MKNFVGGNEVFMMGNSGFSIMGEKDSYFIFIFLVLFLALFLNDIITENKKRGESSI
jgi:hypothetical protein